MSFKSNKSGIVLTDLTYLKLRTNNRIQNEQKPEMSIPIFSFLINIY